MKVNFSDKLILKTREIGVPLCLGLDPHPAMIPELFTEKGSKTNIKLIENFLLEVISLAIGKIVAIKPQVAFFELFGPPGLQLLIRISKYARENNILVIMDAKRGDIDSTSQAYANAWLGANATFPSDALTINPWMGLDSIDPFIEQAHLTNTGVFILLRTSNPGAEDIQEQFVKNERLYIYLAKILKPTINKYIGDLGYSNIGVVVGAKSQNQATQIRKILNKSLFLIPGFGTQGGTAKQALSGLIIRNNTFEGGLINCSRSLLFPPNAQKASSLIEWRKEISESIKDTYRMLSVD